MNRAEQETTSPIDRDQLLGLLGEMAPEEQQAKRTPARPCSQVAAMLPSCSPVRRPRVTRSPPLTANEPMGVAERKAAQAVADVRSRFESVDEVVARRDVSYERLAEIRIVLADVPTWKAPPRIEMKAVDEDCVTIASSPAPVPETEPQPRLVTMIASFVAACVVGFAAGFTASYVLL